MFYLLPIASWLSSKKQVYIHQLFFQIKFLQE